MIVFMGSGVVEVYLKKPSAASNSIVKSSYSLAMTDGSDSGIGRAYFDGSGNGTYVIDIGPTASGSFTYSIDTGGIVTATESGNVLSGITNSDGTLGVMVEMGLFQFFIHR